MSLLLLLSLSSSHIFISHGMLKMQRFIVCSHRSVHTLEIEHKNEKYRNCVITFSAARKQTPRSYQQVSCDERACVLIDMERLERAEGKEFLAQRDYGFLII